MKLPCFESNPVGLPRPTASPHGPEHRKHLLAPLLAFLGFCLAWPFGPVDASADFLVKKGSFVKSTAAAPVDDVVTGVGFQPKAVIFFWTRQDTADVFGAHVLIGYGFATGTANERAVAIGSDDNLSACGLCSQGNTGKRQSQSKCIIILSNGDPTLGAEAELKSLDADGFTITWTTNEAEAGIIHYVAIGGSDITNALAESFLKDTGTGNQSITGLGFQPDFLMLLSNHTGPLDDNRTEAQINIGFASSATDEASVGAQLEDGELIRDTCVQQRTDRILVELSDDCAENTRFDLVSFDADGFTVNRELNNNDGRPVHYLALKGGMYKVGNFNKTTDAAPAIQAVTDVGFQPHGLILASKNLAANTAAEAEGRISFGASDRTTEGATWFHDKDAQNPTIAKQRTSTSKIAVHASQTTLNAEADLVGTFFDGVTGGFTLEWTTNNAVAEEIIYVAFGPTEPTAVELTSFTATGADRAIILEWETASELDNLGFHLYRSLSETGPYERVTRSLIPGLGSSPSGARYRYLDSELTNGVTYYYELEDIETTGVTKRHGPVSVTPEPTSEPVGQGKEPPGAGLIYGEPEGNSFRVLSRDGRQIVVELVTEGFYAESGQEGTVRLHVPGFFEDSEPGMPAIPVKRSWVEAEVGRKVQLGSVQVEGEVSFTALRPSAVEEPEIVATRRGTVRAGARRRGGRGWGNSGWYPEEAARVVEVAFQGEQKKALIELAPLRWDGRRGRLVLAKRLVVRLVFSGREPGEWRRRDGVRGRRPALRSRGRQTRRVVARLAVKQRGLYHVSFEEVAGRRGRPIRASLVRLSRLGEPVAYHLEPDPQMFAPGSVLSFFSEGESLNPYGGEAVYELELGGGGMRMEVVPGAPEGRPIDSYWQTIEEEENRYYLAGLLEAREPWLGDAVYSASTKSYGFEVSRQAVVSEPARLEVWLQGASDSAASPDHHVRVWVNGAWVAEGSWEGKKPFKVEGEMAPGVLREGANELQIENVGDTGAKYSLVLLDRFRVTYRRVAVAETGVLEGRWGESGMAEVAGVGVGARVVELGGTAPRWLSGFESAVDRVRFRAEAGRSYLVVGPNGVLKPEVRRPVASGLRRRGKGAEYLVVGPAEFLEVAEALLELRRSEGLRAEAVSVEEIFSEFGFGEERPEAIREFVSYAFHHWRAPSVRYVLLLGDGSYDFKDYLGTGVVNRVPPFLVKTRYLWTASDPAYASVNGEDILPDLAIGRLPAATVEEVRAMVGKVVAYERAGGAWGAPVVLVADNRDEAGDFEANAEEIASGVLVSRELRKIYLARLGASATAGAVLEAFDEGASLMSYMGHGGIHLWAQENLFHIGRVSSLGPQEQQPLVLTLNCLNGYFHFPYFDALGEALVKAEGRGAIASFSPSGLSLDGPSHLYHKALLRELVEGRHERLGDAILSAQTAYAETGAFPELLRIYHLFGDPALRLP